MGAVLATLFGLGVVALMWWFVSSRKPKKCEDPVSRRELDRCVGGNRERCRKHLDQSDAAATKLNNMKNGEDKYNFCKTTCLTEYMLTVCLCANCPKCAATCDMSMEELCRQIDCERHRV